MCTLFSSNLITTLQSSAKKKKEKESTKKGKEKIEKMEGQVLCFYVMLLYCSSGCCSYRI